MQYASSTYPSTQLNCFALACLYNIKQQRYAQAFSICYTWIQRRSYNHFVTSQRKCAEK